MVFKDKELEVFYLSMSKNYIFIGLMFYLNSYSYEFKGIITLLILIIISRICYMYKLIYECPLKGEHKYNKQNIYRKIID